MCPLAESMQHQKCCRVTVIGSRDAPRLSDTDPYGNCRNSVSHLSEANAFSAKPNRFLPDSHPAPLPAAAVGISGLESDGGDRSFCGGGGSGKMGAGRRPKQGFKAGNGSELPVNVHEG